MKMPERRKFQKERMGNAKALKICTYLECLKKPQRGQCDLKTLSKGRTVAYEVRKELRREKKM